MIPRDVRLAAEVYRRMGWQPLPSYPDAKRPALDSYRQYWDRPMGRQEFDRCADRCLRRHRGCNLQLATGARWRLAVVDLDGLPAFDAWDAMARFRGDPRPWIVEGVDGQGMPRGRHLFYALDGESPPVPSRLLWGIYDPSIIRRDGKLGGWLPRCQIELLGERNLIIAPPSLHTRPGCTYRILRGFDGGLPPLLPGWIADLPAFHAPRPERELLRPEIPLVSIDVCRRIGESCGHFDWEDVVRAIPDKLFIIRSWGRIEFTGRYRGPYALECHAIGRDDDSPSAIVNERSGRYWDPWLKDEGLRTLGFFDLAVRCGAYPDFPSAVEDLGRRYVRPEGSRKHA